MCMSEEKCFIKECNVVNIYKHDALGCWKDIEVGDKFGLDVSSDKKIVLVKYFKDKGNNTKINADYTLGELSEDDAKQFKDYLEMGWQEVYVVHLSQKVENAEENKRLKVVISVKKK